MRDAMADEEPTAEEMRERADKAREKRAAERAARKAEEAAAEKKKDEKKPKKWWSYLIHVALVAVSAYLIWARFIRKEPEQAPEPKPSVSASASVAPTIGLAAGTELRAGAGPMFAAVDTVASATTFEKVEGPNAGWMKVKVPSGKIGWVPMEAIGPQVIAPSPSASVSAAPSSSVSAP
jgi:cytoskeletal protein RodZ